MNWICAILPMAWGAFSACHCEVRPCILCHVQASPSQYLQLFIPNVSQMSVPACTCQQAQQQITSGLFFVCRQDTHPPASMKALDTQGQEGQSHACQCWEQVIVATCSLHGPSKYIQVGGSEAGYSLHGLHSPGIKQVKNQTWTLLKVYALMGHETPTSATFFGNSMFLYKHAL